MTTTVITTSLQNVEWAISILDKVQFGEAVVDNDFARANAILTAVSITAFEIQKTLDAFKEFHPRAVKLLQKQKNFLVVADDEPYFIEVYTRIRGNEKANNTWTTEDEIKFRSVIDQSPNH